MSSVLKLSNYAIPASKRNFFKYNWGHIIGVRVKLFMNNWDQSKINSNLVLEPLLQAARLKSGVRRSATHCLALRPCGG